MVELVKFCLTRDKLSRKSWGSYNEERD